jgi:hypothetical protein
MRKELKRFTDFEKKNDVFDLKVDEVRVWSRIRRDIFAKIKREEGEGAAHTPVKSGTKENIKKIYLLLKNLFWRNPFLSSKKDTIFYGHERRKKMPNGTWSDIYCDPVHSACPVKKVHVEDPYHYSHRVPAETESLRYLDLINYWSSILNNISSYELSFESGTKKRLKKLENEIQNVFGVKYSLLAKIKDIMEYRYHKLYLYTKLLDKIKPKVAVVVVSYCKQIFIEACKKENIPVVELQHGVIQPSNLGYSYPYKMDLNTFPDIILTWGKFWENSVSYPIQQEKVKSTGFPFLEKNAKKYYKSNRKNQIIFISQGTIGKKLSRFAVNVFEKLEGKYNIVYKLHPGEYDRWKSDYPWLKRSNLTVVDSPNSNLYHLLSESCTQIGVYSTVIYEGIYFDLETFIYDCHNSEYMKPLLNTGHAKLVSSPEELVSTMNGTCNNSYRKEHFFESESTNKICKEIESIVDK